MQLHVKSLPMRYYYNLPFVLWWLRRGQLRFVQDVIHAARSAGQLKNNDIFSFVYNPQLLSHVFFPRLICSFIIYSNKYLYITGFQTSCDHGSMLYFHVVTNITRPASARTCIEKGCAGYQWRGRSQQSKSPYCLSLPVVYEATQSPWCGTIASSQVVVHEHFYIIPWHGNYKGFIVSRLA